jgi:hypothetical protein
MYAQEREGNRILRRKEWEKRKDKKPAKKVKELGKNPGRRRTGRFSKPFSKNPLGKHPLYKEDTPPENSTEALQEESVAEVGGNAVYANPWSIVNIHIAEQHNLIT